MFSSTGGGSRLVVAAARIGKAVCIWSQIFWSSAAGKPISTKVWSHMLSKASTHVGQCFLCQVSVLPQLVNLLFSLLIIVVASSFFLGVSLGFYSFCY